MQTGGFLPVLTGARTPPATFPTLHPPPGGQIVCGNAAPRGVNIAVNTGVNGGVNGCAQRCELRLLPSCGSTGVEFGMERSRLRPG